MLLPSLFADHSAVCTDYTCTLPSHIYIQGHSHSLDSSSLINLSDLYFYYTLLIKPRSPPSPPYALSFFSSFCPDHELDQVPRSLVLSAARVQHQLFSDRDVLPRLLSLEKTQKYQCRAKRMQEVRSRQRKKELGRNGFNIRVYKIRKKRSLTHSLSFIQ